MSSHVIRKEQCPRCMSLGKDNSKDNLAVYSDGHTFCYSCRYATFPNRVENFINKQKNQEVVSKEHIYLPVDCDVVYPDRAIKWIEQYELTKEDLYKHNVMWSESIQRLIFPVFADGHLLAWQGRYFGVDINSVKWWGKGNLKKTLNFLGTGRSLIICEDVLSAIKIAKAGYRALSIYGSSIGRERFQEIFNNTNKEDNIVIWLDRDKWKESLAEVKLGKLCGLNCSSINTELDPKLVKIKEINDLLTKHSNSICQVNIRERRN